jgi:hypothetical protein
MNDTKPLPAQDVGTGALFDLPESLSPRLSWMRDRRVRTHFSQHIGKGGDPWCAWLPSNDAFPELVDGVPNDPAACGYGQTEAAAVEHLAAIKGVVNWSNMFLDRSADDKKGE